MREATRQTDFGHAEPLDEALIAGDSRVERFEKFDQARRELLDSDGHLDGRVRRAAFGGLPVPESLARYVEKVRRHAYKVTDEDVAALRDAGLSDDEIFELTIATAVGAGFERLHAGLRAIAGAR